MSDTFCFECKHWERVTPEPADEPEGYGVCNHPSCPWDTTERRERDGMYAACMEAQETCPLHEARKP